MAPFDPSDDERLLRVALACARVGDRAEGANPIGCVIVRDGVVVARAHNEVDKQHDPTAHAEILAIRRACRALGVADLRGATLYSTLQPCGMCTMATIWAKLGRIVYGAGRGDVHPMYFEDRHLDTMDFIADAFRDDLTVTGGVLAAECAALYLPPDADVPIDEQVNR
jgi:tRNA(adenine34) deaminase